ncbi:TPA_asm: hypothetical protein HUJ06_032031 [Nelumbo nucifera]|uniref:Uncharacterized protein n=1 Tax=Nelumbo nucifera TaxID=4432 RepID=A0A822XVB0_NELNU|nr:TPA_asm: hypothetical protein HUJ06_026960 [Nelumbo nucifera]DAD25564.1 TPA_asm: hypothetical protein HUJ06_027028 [Nelumbo nucifera]DAD49310.1 TPA_asm: hypothetical protein HUJ06_032031 [Nelumbo nucifera]
MCSRGHTTILKAYPFFYLQAQIRCGRSGATPVKQRPRRMNPNYAELVCKEGEKEIQRMLDAAIYLSYSELARAIWYPQ